MGGSPETSDYSRGFELYPVDMETLPGDLIQAAEQLGVNLRTFMLPALCRMD